MNWCWIYTQDCNHAYPLTYSNHTKPQTHAYIGLLNQVGSLLLVYDPQTWMQHIPLRPMTQYNPGHLHRVDMPPPAIPTNPTYR